MPDRTQLNDQEIGEIVSIYRSIKGLHSSVGSLHERMLRVQSRIALLREAESKWEKEIEERYHLPSGVNWHLDLDTKSIVMPEEEPKEEPTKEPSDSEEEREGPDSSD